MKLPFPGAIPNPATAMAPRHSTIRAVTFMLITSEFSEPQQVIYNPATMPTAACPPRAMTLQLWGRWLATSITHVSQCLPEEHFPFHLSSVSTKSALLPVIQHQKSRKLRRWFSARRLRPHPPRLIMGAQTVQMSISEGATPVTFQQCLPSRSHLGCHRVPLCCCVQKSLKLNRGSSFLRPRPRPRRPRPPLPPRCRLLT